MLLLHARGDRLADHRPALAALDAIETAWGAELAHYPWLFVARAHFAEASDPFLVDAVERLKRKGIFIDIRAISIRFGNPMRRQNLLSSAEPLYAA